jgi:hypothetical protein
MIWVSLQNIPILSELVRILSVYLPLVVYAIIILVLGWIMSHLVGFLIRSVVGKMGLEASFRKTSVGRSILRTGYTPSSFFVLLGKGVIYLIAVISALQILSIPLITNMVQVLIDYLPNLLGGIIILIVGFISADWIGESIDKGGSSLTVTSSLFGGVIRIFLYFIIITISLVEMKIDITILYIFAQALSWSIAIAIGLAFGWNLKDRVGSWLEGVINHKEKTENDTK